ALFAASLASWWMTGSLPARARLYLRFAAVLFAAIAVSVPFGMSDYVALFLLPLAGVSLMIAALARFAAALPGLIATLALVAGLAGGISAMLWNFPMLALAPLTFAALAIIAAALNGTAIMACLAGVALLGSALVLLEQGSGSGFLLFAAAALLGLAKPGARERQIQPAKKSALAIQQ
ncbi:MAG: hypothetical protein ABI608_06520, partial [Rhizomicrobium sp.]